MKKVLLVNWHSTSSSSLDTRHNPHDIEYLAMGKGYEAAGYELWLQEPYVMKSKLSNWPRKIHRSESHRFQEFDMIQLHWWNRYIWDWLKTRFPEALKRGDEVAVNFVNLVENLHKFSGRIITTIHDPRPAYFEQFRAPSDKRNIAISQDLVKKLHEIFERIEISSALPVAEVLPYIEIDNELKADILSRPNWITNYQYQVGNFYPMKSLRNPNPEFECVYIGEKEQTKIRKKMIKQMIGGISGAYTGGPLVLPKIPNIAELRGLTGKQKRKDLNIPKAEVCDIIRNCRVSIFMAEPGHWAGTPRWWETFTHGSIPAIHPDAPGSHILPTTYKRCTVENISQIPRDREWEIETYEIMKEEMKGLIDRYPPVFERVN
jgi:hypothetical protein